MPSTKELEKHIQKAFLDNLVERDGWEYTLSSTHPIEVTAECEAILKDSAKMWLGLVGLCGACGMIVTAGIVAQCGVHAVALGAGAIFGVTALAVQPIIKEIKQHDQKIQHCNNLKNKVEQKGQITKEEYMSLY